MPFTPTSHPGTLHHYARKLVAFEHASSSSSPNTLIWIGGLGDGPLTVKYTHTLATSLPSTWCLVQIILSSSYTSWGTSSLGKDAEEIAQCIKYLEELRPGKKVVLMGHSTGSQDVMHYLTGPENSDRPTVRGAILQGGISDREGLIPMLPEGIYDSSVALCKEWIAEGRGDDVLPRSATADFFGVPVTARRWLSLLSPDKDQEDDLFSSDLSDEQLDKTFGSLGKCPLLVLYGEKDEFVPESVDRVGLVKRWTEIVKGKGGVVDEENGGVVPGATHNLGGVEESVVSDLCRRVKGFLEKVEGGFEGSKL